MKALERRGLSRVDVALGAVLTLFGIGLTLGGPGSGGWIATLVVGAATLPVIWRRQAPLACAAAVSAGMAISGIPTFDQTRCGAAIPAALFILFALATRTEWRAAVGGLALVVAGVVFLSFTDASIDPAALSFLLPLCAGVWVAGRVVRERDRLAAELTRRTVELEQRREQTAQLAVEVERARMAASLGDESRQGVQEILDLTASTEPAVEVFSRIETGGRDVLNDMRDVLGVLRSDERLVRSAAPQAPVRDQPSPSAAPRLTPGRLAVGGAALVAAAALLSEALGVGELPSAVLLAVIAASYGCGAYASRWVAAGAVGALLVCLVTIEGSSLVPLTFSTVGPLLVGMVVKSRRELVAALAGRSRELEAEEAAFARLAVRRERAKVARDLHDVIAHSLAVVVVQAGAGRVAGRDDERQRLADIRAAALEALDGMARLGEVFRSEDRLENMIDRARAAGLRVNVRALRDERRARSRDRGGRLPRRSRGPDQRAQARPGRRGRRGPARARRGAGGRGLRPGRRAPVTLDGAGAGLGLQGLRERVADAGGRIDAGPRQGGGWQMSAELPLSPRRLALAG